MPQIIEMPKLSDTMTTGTLVKWLKKEGDAVKSGDMLAEVETDKATMELESFFDGTLLKIFAADGAQVAIGEPLAAIGKPGEKVEAPAAKPETPTAAPAPKPEEKPKPEDKEQAGAATTSKNETQAQSVSPAPGRPVGQASTAATESGSSTGPAASRPSGDDARIKISPLARKLAAEKSIDPARVTGSGPGGRIVRADILAAEKSGSARATSGDRALGKNTAPSSSGRSAAESWPWKSVLDRAPSPADATIALSNMRATIARRLVEAKTTIPHFYVEIEIDAAPLNALRKQLNLGLAASGVKLSVNDFILKAAAASLRALPKVNAAWDQAGIKQLSAIHVSFAVAIEDGLITPVIRDTDKKSVIDISREAKDLGRRAKDKKLAPAEFTGGTFCVSNLGMMGVERFSAIINPPNAAILAVGATLEKPVVRDGQIVVGERMSLTLSCDHRVVDGALGAQFLNAIKAHLENPSLLLL